MSKETVSSVNAESTFVDDPTLVGRSGSVVVDMQVKGANGTVEKIACSVVMAKSGKAFLKGTSPTKGEVVGFFGKSGRIWFHSANARNDAF